MCSSIPLHCPFNYFVESFPVADKGKNILILCRHHYKPWIEGFPNGNKSETKKLLKQLINKS